MWGSIPALETVASIAFWVLTIAGALTVIAGAALTVTNDRITSLTKTEADLRINDAKKEAASAIERAAEANRRAEEAKAEAAKTNERLRKSQEMRRLTTGQANALKPLLTSDTFKTDPPLRLRVSTVSDAEAESYALEILKFLVSCGVANDAFPREHFQLNDHETGLTFGVRDLTLSEQNQPFVLFQRQSIACGLDLRVESIPDLSEREAVIYVMRKPPA